MKSIRESLPKSDSDEQLAKEFAEYFMAKIKKIWDALENHPIYKPEHQNIVWLKEFQPLTEQEVSKIIGKIACRSCKIDPIPTTHLKMVLPSVIRPITSIVNYSITTGIFAQTWKTAIIHLLLKKAGLALQLSNFRPVSNLSFLSQVVECAILQQFNKHCKDQDLILDYQSAYHANYSCETALVKIVNNILWAMENKRVTSLMAIDLSTAFNTMDHNILIAVLRERFGTTDTALSWFKSYFCPSHCKVNVGTTYSKNRELVCCVQQGSCASPMLFTVHSLTIESVIATQTLDSKEGESSQMNVIHPNDKATAVTLHRFADDHALKNTFSANSRHAERDSVSTLEAKAADVKVWMDQNHLKMNHSKTKFIMFASRQMLQKCITTGFRLHGSNIQ